MLTKLPCNQLSQIKKKMPFIDIYDKVQFNNLKRDSFQTIEPWQGKNQKSFSISIMSKTSMEQYQQFQDYTNYIDTSDVMLGFYKDQPGTGLQKYYLMIEQWLNMQSTSAQENKPLVIQAEGGVGKKTLLVKWFQYHQQLMKSRGKDDLIILHFATTGGNNSNYYYAIYRILIKLREELNIGQKVELHEEKLRNYFAYWLDVCDQKIERQVIENVDKIFSKIILVFEGIDYFVDRGTNKEGNISFWLPKYFPKNVKVIVTADRQSESMNYFNKLNCPRVNIPVDMQIIRTMTKTQLSKKLCIEGPVVDSLIKILDHNAKEVQVTSLYVKSFLSCLLPQKLQGLSLTPQSLQFIQRNLQKLDTKRLAHVKNVEDLFDYVLDFWSKVLFDNQEKFKELIGLLISTQKGLTRQQIISITKIDSQQLKQFITVFRAFLMNFKDLWMIKNDSFKKSIQKKYQFNQQQINQKIAQALKKTPNSVRKLEEQTFQLYSAGNYFKLKEVISDIENFLLLFNPYTKYDLCRYWQKLEEKSFDPVIEYNKAIEGFEMHYHPNSDDLFRIITQISRFLKEFADFETYYTPEFRHPKIIGNLNQLQDIGILGELKNLDLCECEQDPTKKDNKTEMQHHEQTNENDEEKKYKKKLKEMYDKIEQGKHIKKITKVEIEPVNKQAQKTKGKEPEKKLQPQKQIRVQQLNVQVKSNQNYFRQHYYNQIKPFLQKVSLQGEKQTFALDQGDGQQYVQSDQQTQRQNQHLVQKIRNNMQSKDTNDKSKYQNLPDLKNLYAKTVQEQFQLNQKPPTNYYYKRWIWMQFPWVCMTMKSDYSDKLRKCFTSPTSYMSVSEEREFTIQALKIALQAKKKKQAILEKSQELPQKSTVRKNTTIVRESTQAMNETMRGDKANNDLSYLKENKFEQSIVTNLKEKKARRIEELGFVTNSFLSLHNLSKQMESLNVTINPDKKPTDSSLNHDESKGTLFITENDGQNNTLNQSQSCMNLFNKKRKMNKEIDESMNLTTSKSRQGLLPRIKQSVNTSMMKELEELEKNNAQLRKNMDTYIYKNKILAKRLKQLKIIQYNNKSQLKNSKKMEQKKQKIKQIQAKIQKVKYMYANSLLQHQRQDLLIKICKRNKTNNEQKIPELVQECNNFKKMIKIQSQAILDLKKKTEEIKKLTKKFVSNYCEKIENEMQLQEEIKQTLKNRDNFIEEVDKYDKLIQQEVQEKRKQLNQQLLNGTNICQKDIQKNQSMCHSPTKGNGNPFGNQSKKWPSHHNGSSNSANQQQQNYEQTFKQLIRYLNIDSQNFQQDPKYIKLVERLNKKREFEAVIDQRKMELEGLKKRHAELKHQLQTLDRAKEEHSLLCNSQTNDLEDTNQQQVADSERGLGAGREQTQEELEKQLAQKKRMLTKATDVKLACLGMLNTWYVRLGLPQQKNLSITKDFLERLEEIKVMNRVEVC